MHRLVARLPSRSVCRHCRRRLSLLHRSTSTLAAAEPPSTIRPSSDAHDNDAPDRPHGTSASRTARSRRGSAVHRPLETNEPRERSTSLEHELWRPRAPGLDGSVQPSDGITSRKPPSYWKFRGDQTHPRRKFKSARPPIEHDSVDLGVDALGRPATIHIVQDAPTPKQAPRPREPVLAPASLDAEKLERLALSSPTSAAGPAEVDATLDRIMADFRALRPVEGSFTRKQCVAVADHLAQVLTGDQMTAHFHRREVVPRTSDVLDLERFYSSKLVTRARWFSQQSPFPQTAATRLDSSYWKRLYEEPGAITTPAPARRKTLSPKRRIIERILRQLWGVRERQEVGMGELDFRIHNPFHLKVLLRHHDEVFRRRSEHYGVKIEISEKDVAVRITGEYGVTADVFQLIHDDLRRIEMRAVELGPELAALTPVFKHSALRVLSDRTYRAHIEQLTHTAILPRIRLNQDDIAQRLEVYFLGPDETDLDDARRLLAQVTEQKEARHTQVQCDRAHGSALPIEVPIEPGHVLPLREQYSNWMRWIFPGSYKSKAAQAAALGRDGAIVYSPADGRALALRAAQHLSGAWSPDTPAGTPSSPFWQATEQRQLTAMTGFLVHPTESKIRAQMDMAQQRTFATAAEREQHIEATFQRLMAAPRTLLTGVPDLWTRLSSVATGTPTVRNTLHIRLTPGRVAAAAGVAGAAARAPPEDVRLYPELELVFEADERQRTTQLQAVRLVRAWREADVLLPAHATDLRFTARGLIAAGAAVDPAILAFTAHSRLDVFGDGRLHTPARMTLAIPRLACETRPGPALAGSGSCSMAAPRDLRVDYFFAGLEYRSSLHTLYQGHATVYSTVEAGSTGGRRQELRFELPDLPAAALSADAPPAARQLYLDWFDSVREFTSRLFH